MIKSNNFLKSSLYKSLIGHIYDCITLKGDKVKCVTWLSGDVGFMPLSPAEFIHNNWQLAIFNDKEEQIANHWIISDTKIAVDEMLEDMDQLNII